MDPEELYHVNEVHRATQRWYTSFTGPASDESNADAADAIQTMECHMQQAAYYACETTGRAFACCAFTQYHTWLRVAALLTNTIIAAFGNGACGTRHLGIDELEQRFAQGFAEIVYTPPAPGVRGVAQSTSRAVLGWAARGVCPDGAKDTCAALSHVHGTELVSLRTLLDQTDVAWYAQLMCAQN